MVFQKDHVFFDDDILQHTAENIETLIQAGEHIATSP